MDALEKIKDTTKTFTVTVEKHQYLKCGSGSYLCECGEPMINDVHYDDVKEWHHTESWRDKPQLLSK